MRSIAWLVFVLIAICALAGQQLSALLMLAVAGSFFLLVLGLGLVSISGGTRSVWPNVVPSEALSVKFAVTDPKGRILFATTAFRDAAGITADQNNVRQLGEGDPQSAEAIYRLFDAGRGKRQHVETLRLGGQEVRVSVQTISGSASASHLQWTIDDVRELDPNIRDGVRGRDTGNVASQPADISQTIWREAPVAVAWINHDGVVIGANTEFGKLFDQTIDISKKRLKLVQLFHKDGSFGQFCSSISRMDSKIKQAGAIRLQCEALTLGSRPRRLRLTATFSPDRHCVILFASETGVAAILDEQTVQNQKLQAVGELAGGIAHDFNNLLTSIIGFSDLLLARFRHSDPAFKDLMNIKNNANRAAGLVSQILAYSRKQTLRPTLVVLTDVIQDFHSSVGRLLGEKITAKIDHGRDLWFVKADEHQLFQVIMNLAVNARDAMPNGGTLSIRTANVTSREAAQLEGRGLARGEYVLCEVRDTGTGIAADHLQRIFDPFFSTKEVGKGTGLGLSTVYGIVKQTGGTVLVDSKVGAGTAFSIYLPRHRETEDELAVRLSKGTEKTVTADLTGSSTVLLVEDEESVRSFASRALVSRGYKVLEAASGVEALEVMDREGAAVDLVVSDVVMPEMDGPTLLRHLRQRNPKIKIVFMSGYAEEAFRKNLDPGEAFTFLPKPFTLKTLAETVKAAAA